MSPRPYRLGQRQETSDQTRERIIEAAHDLLLSCNDFSRFSIDAVARQAQVASMTVYHQFGSKVGLLEGIFDSLAANAGIPLTVIKSYAEQKAAPGTSLAGQEEVERLLNALHKPDSLDILKHYINFYAHIWQTDRVVMRRIHALAALDADIDRLVREHVQRGHHGLRYVLQRIQAQHGYPGSDVLEGILKIVYSLVSFEYCDLLAGPERSLEEVTPQLYQLVYLSLGMNREQLQLRQPEA
jgi:AcrR family transcriptional regulator